LLVGITEDARPPLYLEDFIIALRNVYEEYVITKNDTTLYTYPGCSIDPDTPSMAKIDVLGETLRMTLHTPGIDQEDKNQVLENYREACILPHKVSVMGVPFYSHFARVMVEADYHAKMLADGTDSLDLAGFISQLDIRIDQAIMRLGKPQLNDSGWNRYWFNPDEVVIEHNPDQTIFFIKQAPVKISTERIEAIQQPQQEVDSVALEFTHAFTRMYDIVAIKRPIYRELENLFRWVVAARIIHLTQSPQRVGLTLDYMLKDFSTSYVHVDSLKPGRFAHKTFEFQQSITNGMQYFVLSPVSCGGVDIRIRQEDIHTPPKPSTWLTSIRNILVNRRRNRQQRLIPAPCSNCHSAFELNRYNYEVNRKNTTFQVFTVVPAMKNGKHGFYLLTGEQDPVFVNSGREAGIYWNHTYLSRYDFRDRPALTLDFRDVSVKDREAFLTSLRIIEEHGRVFPERSRELLTSDGLRLHQVLHDVVPINHSDPNGLHSSEFRIETNISEQTQSFVFGIEGIRRSTQSYSNAFKGVFSRKRMFPYNLLHLNFRIFKDLQINPRDLRPYIKNELGNKEFIKLEELYFLKDDNPIIANDTINDQSLYLSKR
jgi:hypothetical protein